MKQAIILSGGMGTRLKSALQGLPKPMADIGGKPLLQHQVELASQHGLIEILLLTGYRSDAIESYFKDGKDFGVHIQHCVDPEPLGTAGAVLDAFPMLQDRFVVLYGDTMLNVDLTRFHEFHTRSGADVSLFLHPNDHPHDSDLVEIDEGGRITRFHPYPHQTPYLPNLVNAALYIIEKRALQDWAGQGLKLDFAKGLFPLMLEKGVKLFGYHSREYIKDMGTPERLEKVRGDFASGKIARSALSHPKPAIFLDRDGTLTRQTDYVRSAAELETFQDTGPSIRKINRSDYLAVLTTNQPVIARGEVSYQGLKEIHGKLEYLLGNEHAFLDGIYFCPHHPDRGFAGERPELKVPCNCRKPAPGMLLQAAKDLAIDLKRSWMIGDSTVDIRAAKNAEVKSILLRTGMGGTDRKFPDRPDFEFFDLEGAVDFILNGYPKMREQLAPLASAVRAGELIAIGGLARSGKSILASVLAELVREAGIRCHVISCDCYLISEQQRGPGVRNRYDYLAIGHTGRSLFARQQSLTLQLGRYDRMAKQRFADGETLVIEPGDAVIIEGVIALDVPEIQQFATHKVYVECSEEARLGRFLREYALRGLSEKAALELYEERDRDEEHLLVRQTAMTAQYRLRSEV